MRGRLRYHFGNCSETCDRPVRLRFNYFCGTSMATRDETRRQSSWSPVWVQNVESCASRQYHNWLRLLWCCCCRPGLCWTHFMIRDHNRDELFLRNLNICLLLYTRLLQGQSEGHQLLTMMINVVVGLMFSKVAKFRSLQMKVFFYLWGQWH